MELVAPDSISLIGELPTLPRKPYASWAQVAGYFDGDGNVTVVYRKFIVSFIFRRADQSRSQIEQLRKFLISERVCPTPKILFSGGSHQLTVAKTESIVKCAQEMVLYCFKKQLELQTVLDYHQNLLTGEDVSRRFAELASMGERERFRGQIPPIVDIPHKRSEAIQSNIDARLRNSGLARRLLTPEQL